MFKKVLALLSIGLLLLVQGNSSQPIDTSANSETEVSNSTISKRGPWNGALVHYYWDGNCKDFANEVHVTDNLMDGPCVNYYIAGAWSMNVVDCWNSGCYCIFYTEENCKGTRVGGSGNIWDYKCVNDNGVAVRSMSCAYMYN